jgi:YesN/AraC family two-component response regulator
VKDIVNAIGVPYEYLRKAFRRHRGKGMWKCVEETRAEYAKELLEITEWKCYRIAIEIGLHDEASFTKFFKRMVGVTPKAYRQQCRARFGTEDSNRGERHS